MKKVMYISFPATGHINPIIKLCKELSDRNVTTLMYTNEFTFNKFSNIKNVELKKYPESYEKRMLEFRGYADKIENNIPLIYNMLYSACEDVLEFLIDEIRREKPAIVLCDSFSIWGKMAAVICNVPYGMYGCGFLIDDEKPNLGSLGSIVFHFPTLFKAISIRKKFDRKYGKIFNGLLDAVKAQGKFTFIMTSRELQPNGDKYSDLVKFLGPTNIEDYELVEKDTIFISFGTIMTSTTFFDKCIEATKDLKYNVVITFGGNTKNSAKLADKYEHVKVYNELTIEEHNEMLKKSVLFISHGGFNSLHEALCYRTPVLVFPQTLEQYTNAEVLMEKNCAKICDKKDISIDELKKLMISIIENSSMRESVNAMRNSLENSLGFAKFVDYLIKEFNL